MERMIKVADIRVKENEEAEELLDLLAEHGFQLVEDEIFGDECSYIIAKAI